MMLHMFELATSSWLAYYARNVLGGDIVFQLCAWAVFFLMLFLVDMVTAD